MWLRVGKLTCAGLPVFVKLNPNFSRLDLTLIGTHRNLAMPRKTDYVP
jgi:hypothetical protein